MVQLTRAAALETAACLFAIASVHGQDAHRHDPSRDALDSLLNVRVEAVSKYDESASEAPASVTIISSDEIASHGYRNLAEALNSVRGFYLTNDLNYEYVGVMGFSRPSDYNNRVLLLVNGHTLNDAVYGSAPLGNDLGLDFASVERIEVIRGPASALYGTSAMCAVVNVVTKKGRVIDGAGASVGYGSFGRKEVNVRYGTSTTSGLDVALSARWLDVGGEKLFFGAYDDPATDFGIADHRDGEQALGAFGTVSYGSLQIQGGGAARTKWIPTASFGTIFNDPGEKTIDRWVFGEAQCHLPMPESQELVLRLSIDRYRYRGDYPYADSTGRRLLDDDGSDGDWGGAELRYRWDPAPSDRIVAGIEYLDATRSNYRNALEGVTTFSSNRPFTVGSAYLQNALQATSDLSITAGLRFDTYSDNGSAVNPRIGIVDDVSSEARAKLVYSQAYRRPNLYEATYQDSATSFVANPALAPERIRTLEAMWEQRLLPQLTVSGSIFRYEMRDLIDTYINEETGTTEYRNVSSVDANGFGFEALFRGRRGLLLRASYSYQSAKDGSGARISNSPYHLVRLSASRTFFDRIVVAGDGSYDSGRLTLVGTTTGAFVLFNAAVTVRRLLPLLTLRFDVKNLFDTRYFVPGGAEHLDAALPQYGRDFMITADCSL